MTDPSALHGAGVKWLMARGGTRNSNASRHEMVMSFGENVKRATSAEKIVGQYGSAIRWLIVSSQEKTGGSHGQIKICATECKVLSCADGFYMTEASSLAGACAECVACPAGMFQERGYIGANSCYWDADSLKVKVSSEAGHPANGMYTKLSWTHHGFPIYIQHASGEKKMLRFDAVNGWVITDSTNWVDGAKWKGDLTMPAECACDTTAPLPQLIVASACDGCTNAKWSEHSVLIEEHGSPPRAPTGDAPSLGSCEVAQSRAGTAAYCANPPSGEAEGCTAPGAMDTEDTGQGGGSDSEEPGSSEDADDADDDGLSSSLYGTESEYSVTEVSVAHSLSQLPVVLLATFSLHMVTVDRVRSLE
eukprot:gnl/TRDRNA2_/TRDRNA2_71663_c0_seq1.p1 gnl/TRDRNA2_/TRDRNA2_71663_c0~~gnl/TRDRNA2_/TRDRNA2_71663_c0_seq1.p1  ORF type:complete len:363 (-),score=51.16 gnl/TRDRNA2_/TRDRNA2_71663_c0_seq1:59-1147(-)